MIFYFLQFANYRPYYGIQRIALHSDEDSKSPFQKNIVLIGGLNGAGKTSLINAIYICLYGRRMFLREEYEQFKSTVINRRYLREGGKISSIELGISDETGYYIIEIIWAMNIKSEIEESRKIFISNKDGNKLREMVSSEEEFNDFIDKRIPLEVSKFFIFDAEKIRELVDEQDQQKTIDAIQKIVSLDLYKQLLVDLEHIKYIEEHKLSKKIKDSEVQKLVKELEECTSDLENFTNINEQEKEEISKLRSRRQEVEHLRRLKLAQSSSTKMQISQSIGNKEKEVEMINAALQSFSKTTLPYQILINDIKSLKERLKKEHDYLVLKNKEQIAFAPFEQFIAQLLEINIEPPLLQNQKRDLQMKGKDLWGKLNHIHQVKLDEIKILHDLSPNEYQRLIHWSFSTDQNIKQYVDRRYKLLNEIKELNDQLGQAPEKIDTEAFDRELEELSERLIDLESNRKNHDKIIIELRSRRTNLLNEIKRKRNDLVELGPVEEKLEFVEKCSNVLKEFIRDVTILKANQLKSEIENIISKLFRKEEFDRIEFNPNEFTLRIFNQYDEEIDLLARSEGEKQLIALAMIWALTKVSGSNLPFVIDTPLARLDSVHRSHIVNRYFTNLSKQVIILSTDTEITKDFVDEISPFVQQSYILSYSDEEESTAVKVGYFEFEGVS